MGKQFLYPPINSLYGYQVIPVDSRFNTDPYMPSKRCYAQKRENDDVDTLQFFSDWIPTMTVYRSDGIPYTAIACVAQTVTVTNPGFTAVCYQATINYNAFPPGKYNIRIHWVDDNAIDQYFQIMWISVALKWPKTLWFQYKNDINDFGILFNTGIVFNTRIEAALINTVQKFTGDSYVDEEQNATALPSIVYEQKTLSLGADEGVPDWEGKKFNYIMQCSFILIELQPYQKIQGSKWDINRPELASFREETTSNYSIDVMLVDNAFVERLISSNVGLNSYVPYVQVDKFLGVATDQIAVLSGGWAGLQEIWVTNINNVVFTLNVGTTPGASDLGQFDIPVGGKICEVKDAFFSSSANIYLSGLTGVAGVGVSMAVFWMDFNAVPQVGPNAPAVSTNRVAKGSQISYFEILPGDFLNDFDITTGLGKSGGNYPNCVLCDGRNNSPNLGGKFKVGFVNGDPTFGVPAAEVGDNNIIISAIGQLPPHSFIFQRPRADIVGTQYQGNFAKGGGDRGLYTGDDANTNSIGNSDPIPFLPLSLVSYEILGTAN